MAVRPSDESKVLTRQKIPQHMPHMQTTDEQSHLGTESRSTSTLASLNLFRLAYRLWLWIFHKENVATKEEREKHCLPVSRHGLDDKGVICPRCHELAVEPGDWRKIHKIERIDTKTGRYYYEEAVCCPECNAFLMASPASRL